MKRGKVVNLRYSQFRPDVVRIVVDLDGPQTYKVDHSGGAVRVSFDSGDGFQAWSSTAAAAAAQMAEVAAPADQPAPAPATA